MIGYCTSLYVFGTSIRHVVCPGQIIYPSCELKSIRRSTFRSLLPADVWNRINDLGKRRPNWSKRASRKKAKRQQFQSKLESVNCDLWKASSALHIDHPNRATRSPVSIPAMVYANIRQVLPKLDERVPVRLVTKTKRFADFCTVKFRDQM